MQFGHVINTVFLNKHHLKDKHVLFCLYLINVGSGICAVASGKWHLIKNSLIPRFHLQ